MSDFDREALKHLLERHQPRVASRNRSAARRIAHQEREAAIRQIREQTIQQLEGELKQIGVDLRRVRVVLGRNRKRMDEAIAAVNSRPAPNPAGTITRGGHFRTLRALAGRAVPLDQPTSLFFLNEPVSFSPDESGNYLVSSSIAANNNSFRTFVSASNNADYANYTFGYAWSNDSDNTMLVNVSTALEVNGVLQVGASSGIGLGCAEDKVQAYIGGELTLGFTDNLDMETRKTTFGSVTASNNEFLGLSGPDIEEMSFNQEAYGFSILGFVVPPNAMLVIQVLTSFWFDFEPTSGSNNFVGGDFANDDYGITCSGVVVLASPVQTIQ